MTRTVALTMPPDVLMPHSVGQRPAMLSLDEIAIYVGSRDEALALLRDLRIKTYGKRPPRVPVAVVDAWLRRQRRTA